MSEQQGWDWLALEYDHLLEHYKQDDDWSFRFTGIMITVHGAGFALLVSGESFAEESRVPLTVLCLFGVALAIAWAIAHIRLTAYRDVHDRRIAELERFVANRWPRSLKPTGGPMTVRDWDTRLTSIGRGGRILTSIRVRDVILMLPAAAAIFWAVLTANTLLS